MAGSLQGKVVVVTGAGRGIGREIALLAAAEGAKVVVNDLGGSADGDGPGSAARLTRWWTRSAPPAARPSPTAPASPIPPAPTASSSQAVESFGRIDCVVNNAGILRDRIFHKMSVDDFETVIKVHLIGTFYVSRAAAASISGSRRAAASCTSPRPPG